MSTSKMNLPRRAFLKTLCAGLPMLSSPSLWAQKPIRVNVKLVNVSFVARDANNALVGGLKQEDLEVMEDNTAQRIAFFSESADVPLNIGIILDISGSQDKFGKKHKHDLEKFLKDTLRPKKDRAFLLCFGNHLRIVSDFSDSPREIMDRYEEFTKDKGKSWSHYPELEPDDTREAGTAFFDSIYDSVTEKLAATSGKRALLIFSDGEDNSSSHEMMETLEAAQAANVQIYTIRYTETKHGKLTARNKYGTKVMDRLAEDTGAMHIDATKTDPKEYFQKIAEELRLSYELAYYPTNPNMDNNFRKIKIKTRQPGVQIRSKVGYFSRE